MNLETKRIYGIGEPEYDGKFIPTFDENGECTFFPHTFADTLELGDEVCLIYDNTGKICDVQKLKVEW